MKPLIAIVTFRRTAARYAYYTLLENLKAGDYVIVDSSTGIGIATFEKYVDESRNVYSWILDRVDIDKLRALLKIEKLEKIYKNGV